MEQSITDALVKDEVTANRLFREYTRSTAFKLNLGIQEIRMIKQGFNNAWAFTAQDLAVMKRLMDKGLLIHERDGESPKLTQAGKLVQILLHISGHIVHPVPTGYNATGTPQDWTPKEVLNEISHAFDNGRHSMLWWPSELFQAGEEAVLAIQPKYNGDARGGRPRRWLIRSDQIGHDYAGRTSEERRGVPQ